MSSRRLIVPALFTILGVVLLTSLGVWQLERREWKLALIERLDTRAHDAAISLTGARELWQKSHDVEYYRMVLVGRFLHDQERYLYTVIDGQQGWSVITPLVTAGGDVVLVNRGFVPEDRKSLATRQEGLVPGVVELTGLARASGTKTWFTPDNNPAANRWFWRDIPALAASLTGVDAARIAPFMVEAEAAPVPGGWPKGGVTRLELPNRHLEYAITWFSLAAALVVIFGLWLKVRLHSESKTPDNARIAETGPSV